jgi:hypothetical protein
VILSSWRRSTSARGHGSPRLRRRSPSFGLIVVRALGRGGLHWMRVPDTSAVPKIRNRLHSDAHRRILTLRRTGDGEIRRWTLDRDGSRRCRVRNAHLMQSARRQAPTPARRNPPKMQRLAWISGAGVDDRMTGAGTARSGRRANG